MTIKCFIFSRNVSTFLSANNLNKAKLKKGRMHPLHRIRREEKFMYGPLTKKDRQTVETTTNTSQCNNTSMDSELWWHLKHSKYMMKQFSTVKPISIGRVKTIKVFKKMNVSDHASKCNIKEVIVPTKENIAINSVTSKDAKEVETTYAKQDTDKLKIPSSKNVELLDVVINNITSFPILNLGKKLPEKTGKIDILSVSGKDNPTSLHYPSVTKILAATLSAQSRKALEMWKARLIKEMGEDKFNEYYQEQLNSGTLFHSCIENTLYGRSVDIPDKIQPAVDSLSDIVKELKDIRAIESHVSHEHLRYKGKIDCVAVYRGELCAIDWKKSEKDKNSLTLTYDAPVQIAAYIGALNYSKSYPFTVNTGLIVVGYTNGKPADTYVVKDNILNRYWRRWLSKLQQYWTLISKKD